MNSLPPPPTRPTLRLILKKLNATAVSSMVTTDKSRDVIVWDILSAAPLAAWKGTYKF
jgi:hypothetical protein